MLNEKNAGGVAPGSLEGARSATGGEPGAAAEGKRWSAARKKEVVLRLLRGEPVDAVSREVTVPIYKLEQWRDRALAGIDAGLKERENDPVANQLDDANRRIGDIDADVANSLAEPLDPPFQIRSLGRDAVQRVQIACVTSEEGIADTEQLVRRLEVGNYHIG